MPDAAAGRPVPPPSRRRGKRERLGASAPFYFCDYYVRAAATMLAEDPDCIEMNQVSEAEGVSTTPEMSASEPPPPPPAVEPAQPPQPPAAPARRNRPTRAAIILAVKTKLKLLHLAIEQEALRQLYGDDHEQVIELQGKMDNIKRILAITKIIGSELTESQLNVMREEARIRVTWMYCPDSVRGL